ncbi:MAG: galactose-1-epimerase [Pontiellaceae bacterium]|nr:galactose-1-epimerase [Pontiellaceae bacterium]MBN2786497.1 galactose-1-epimerase [Pontiellaceae bacterium]
MRKSFFYINLFLLLFGANSFSIPNEGVPCCETKADGAIATPSIHKRAFGEADGKKVYEYTLKNCNGMQVKVINYGASISDIITPDRDGTPASVVLGFDTLEEYKGGKNALMGATVGRFANRISDAKFTLDGQEYNLSSYIHGGAAGFDKKFWDIIEVPGENEVALQLTYFSKDGEEGFPGNLNVTVTYTLTNQNELKIDYRATTDKATPLVLTNHTYFNLSGGKDAKTVNTELSILADRYLEAGAQNIPTGRMLDVKGTPMDFSMPQLIGSRIDETGNGGGYDLTYALRNQSGNLALAATAYEPLSGRKMDVYTTEPGLVFYTGNHLHEGITGRGGKSFSKFGAFCLETQHYPDSPNKPTFPNCILRPGETFRSQTIFRFSVKEGNTCYKTEMQNLYAVIESKFHDSESGYYFVELDPAKRETKFGHFREYSWLWALCTMFEAANEVEKVEGITGLADGIFKNMQHYYDPAPPKPGYGEYIVALSRGQRYYDDNQWIGIAALEIYERTGNEIYLDLGKSMYDFMMTAYDSKLGGGLYWREGDFETKNTCSNGPGILVALKLYKATHDKTYLDTALKIYDWTNEKLQTPEGLFFDNIKTKDASIGKAIFSYNTGTMLQSNVYLYEITGEEKYLKRAINMAGASLSYFYESGRFRDDYWFNAVLLRGYQHLLKHHDDLKYIIGFKKCLDHELQENKNEEGLFVSGDSVRNLVSHGGMLEILARFAEIERDYDLKDRDCAAENADKGAQKTSAQ